MQINGYITKREIKVQKEKEIEGKKELHGLNERITIVILLKKKPRH